MALRIDIVSDVMCPWCIVGYKQLERALIDSGTEAEIYWHPFELNPQMGPTGQNLREHITEKYGSTAEQSEEVRTRLTELGETLGFDFKFADDSRIYNTFSAHQLIHWAGEQGKSHALKQALFAAYFTDGRDVSQHDVLADVAAGIGLDRAEALAVLQDGRFADEVRNKEDFWASRGISGVPAMIFDRQHLVTGAQGTDTYRRFLTQLAGSQAAG
ncbi:DsbA family oxidoreductase [Cognatishimia sp. SS12]|uniref:DsbA family oxidoreductase n=1 Tax=Cognatishimia sp. SS12 TaxID=2979465 RepID=UPI00233066A7|nr:DsbA family oxidoreductase [Cognatishimia sp. SS12]MDC0738682.1 DsbA family oxidoreductase [Cognatishimia sp. SS12]